MNCFYIQSVPSPVDADSDKIVETVPTELTKVETEDTNIVKMEVDIEKPSEVTRKPDDQVIVLSNSDDEDVATTNDKNSKTNEETLVINDIDIEEDEQTTNEQNDRVPAKNIPKDVISTSIEEYISTYKVKRFVKPYGPHPTPFLNCYKCPLCNFATAEALTMAEHLICETDVDK